MHSHAEATREESQAEKKKKKTIHGRPGHKRAEMVILNR